MKNRNYTSNVALPVVLGVFLLVCLLIRTFNPMAVLPRLDVPMVVAVSLVALLAAHYLAKTQEACDAVSLVLAALTFGLLPYVLGLTLDVPLLAATGSVSLSMGAGDFYNVYNALTQMPRGAKTYLHKFNSYWYMP